MTRRQRAAAAIGAVVLVVVGVVAVRQTVAPLSIDVCVDNYEDPNFGGDHWAVCNTSPTLVKIPNLTTHTENLHNGCNRISNTSSSWNDCISSAKVAALPASYRVRWFQDTNYGGNLVACSDANGDSQSNVPNDIISSFRIEAGSC